MKLLECKNLCKRKNYWFIRKKWNRKNDFNKINK